MRKGFIFNDSLCVNCKACSAACLLENKWTAHPRNIFTYNNEAVPVMPVINLSLACNHCESAVCMDGCPASAYTRESKTGAILLDDSKCIGCRYCQWNCPYEAPKYDDREKVIVKCNLCYTRVLEGNKPACALACPTGALRFGELSESVRGNHISWFPDKKLNPSIEFTGESAHKPLQIIPERPLYQNLNSKEKKNITSDIPLIIFSFLTTISVANMAISFISGKYPGLVSILPLIIAGLISILHLGRKMRFLRSLSNPLRSPLTREIVSFILFSFFTLLTVFIHSPVLLIISAATGLACLMLIDGVYIFSERSKEAFLKSGQTLLSSLIIISFLTGSILPFIFIALIKLTLSVYLIRIVDPYFNLRFFRMAFLIIPGMSLFLNSHPDLIVILMFLTGELIDRILFYIDFNPLNISKLINE